MIKQTLMGAVFVAAGTLSAAAQHRDVILQKVQVPGTNFDIVLAMSASPTTPTFGVTPRKDALVVYPIGEELAYATTGEIEDMLKDVGSSLMPIHAFRVESSGPRSSTALNVYVVPRAGTNGELEPSTLRRPHKRSDGGAVPMPQPTFGFLEFDWNSNASEGVPGFNSWPQHGVASSNAADRSQFADADAHRK